ncbi:MAG: histidine kinase [Spirochaetales bacterium]|nr:histidine kinase [Spirochaetales bacterium]
MITHLSDFFKTMLSSGRDVITIQEEKEHLLSYLEIQRIRYQDILSYSIDFPPELLQYKILKLTLQPLVENSLYHGIKEKRGKGYIAIKTEIKEDCILFTVSDNGRGMSKEELEKLKVDIQIKPEDQKKSFGLYNVQQRLVLKYGIGYGIIFESKLNEGTIATVKIPINK